ncbi:MAG: hypothetical protein KZQ78_16035 [Candidatus Thiodiazotropha sp. (ex Ustalcina ferruginea)]|nr:hypothetical protein [Candidatus Thiodiazotropha sp. (ex Ustalcina ferruginea)]
MKIIYTLILLLLVSACSSIERTSKVEHTKLLVGKDKNNIVAEKIGLPNKIKREGSKEYWLYSGEGTNHDLILAIPLGVEHVSGNTYNIHYLETRNKETLVLDSNIILVCVFNSDKVLIDAFKPDNKGGKQ